MSAHPPIGSCCSRPRFNAIGRDDECALKYKWDTKRLIDNIRKVDSATAAIAIGITLAALVLVYAYAQMFVSN